jgi:hypothetical protein
VRHGQELVFSKKETGRFPQPGEVVRLVAHRAQANDPIAPG